MISRSPFNFAAGLPLSNAHIFVAQIIEH